MTPAALDDSPRSNFPLSSRNWEAGADFSKNQDHEFQPRSFDTPSIQTAEKNTSLGTLHLDGAALGRWAEQHLERSLGRPTSGMTGIDPRATLPRSRVAPF